MVKRPLLSAEQEIQLAKLVQAGDEQAKTEFIESNFKMVAKIARQYVSGNHNLDYLDLVQEGFIGLNRAVEKFDPEQGYKFSTYAYWWIKQAMQRAVAQQGHTIRIPLHIVEAKRSMESSRKRLFSELGREPPTEEIFDTVSVPKTHFEAANNHPEVTVSLNSTVGKEQSGQLMNLIPDETSNGTYELAAKSIVHQELIVLLEKLDAVESQIIDMRYGLTDNKPRTLESVAKGLKMSRLEVRQIEKTAERKLAGTYQTPEAVQLSSVAAPAPAEAPPLSIDQNQERAGLPTLAEIKPKDWWYGGLPIYGEEMLGKDF